MYFNLQQFSSVLINILDKYIGGAYFVIPTGPHQISATAIYAVLIGIQKMEKITFKEAKLKNLLLMKGYY